MPDERRRPTIARVVASYAGTPCAKLRPADAPVRPGEPCGEIHTCCRGHVRNRDAANYGDPCGTPALLGILTCRVHGGQLPEARAVNRRARAERAVGQLIGTTGPVEDPVRVLAETLGEMRAWRDATRELVAMIQAEGPGGIADDHDLLLEAGGEWVVRDKDGAVVDRGLHPEVTGNLLVRDPAGHYVVHPIVKMAEDADARLVAALGMAAKLGIEERMARLEEQQIDLTMAALRLMFERQGLDPDDAMGLFLTAARDVDALGGTVRETIEAHVVRTLPDEVVDSVPVAVDPAPGVRNPATEPPVWP